jgi:hypothetical protein
MNRSEEYRRHQTAKHQQRQIRLYKQYKGSDTGLTDKTLGRFKKHSFCDCGTPNCPMCMNPRHNKVFSAKDQLTIDEQRWIEKFRDELKEL